VPGWRFPEVPFNLQDRGGTFADCRVVDEDDLTVTFDYTATATRARMRVQLLKDTIEVVSWPSPVDEQVESLIRSAS
jgi:hypothetical protein